ncbi:hypothetical protein GJ700_17780 [Duganella sp. FT92W]|uniref:RNA-directed DNA polymerase n=1 Tax=Pseudoduganella rivuli TaxID=2666085 RepID=A0A7X2IP85_9BURK|nr:reverse transcriptase family protein [Pseudoduganella rivuli]MRV73566.1 hypothetical protein [Pseudoduganella rivuli]
MDILESFSKELNLFSLDGFSVQLLAGAIADSSKFYRSFKIPKRRGGNREISAPFPFLANIQKAIANKLRDRIPSSDNAFAYREGRNAIMHASTHLGNRELLTVDIRDFFGSITRQQIHQSLLECNFDGNFSHISSLLSTLHGTLPQGGCASPILSNLVFYSLDIRLARLASALDITYSRYADDLAFSGDYIPRNLPRMVEKIIKEKGFALNNEKTKLKIFGARKIITGVSISSGKPKAPRQFVRALRAEVHALENNKNRLHSLTVFDPLRYERVLGKLNYWLQIEPNNSYAIEKRIGISIAHQKFLGLSANFKLEDYIQLVA